MLDDLTAEELVALIERVFAPKAGDRRLTLLVDLPDGRRGDGPAWAARRGMVGRWRDRLAGAWDGSDGGPGLEVALYQMPHAGSNNADLAPRAWRVPVGEGVADSAEGLDPGASEATADVLAASDLILAPTELSATAPLKVAARRHGFRAGTMPGFVPAMLPALRLDFGEIDRRVRRLAALLDRAEGARIAFRVSAGEGGASPSPEGRFELALDLRHRRGVPSSGVLHEPGSAGNVPSGEAYIVPYEGERTGDPSRSVGHLPVQLDPDDGEVAVYRIAANRAIAVESQGPASAAEAERLAREPAYGNLAELGLGVLAAFGIAPIGTVLLDEKLGLHIAFGRSDHFPRGTVGPGDFRDPAETVHLDRVYLPGLQPRIAVPEVDLVMPGGVPFPLMRDGEYVESIWEE